jgi:hypothetical protein
MVSGQKPEHFVSLSAGLASQERLNLGSKAGIQIAYPQLRDLFFCLWNFALPPLPLRPQN